MAALLPVYGSGRQYGRSRDGAGLCHRHTSAADLLGSRAGQRDGRLQRIHCTGPALRGRKSLLQGELRVLVQSDSGRQNYLYTRRCRRQ